MLLPHLTKISHRDIIIKAAGAQISSTHLNTRSGTHPKPRDTGLGFPMAGAPLCNPSPDRLPAPVPLTGGDREPSGFLLARAGFNPRPRTGGDAAPSLPGCPQDSPCAKGRAPRFRGPSSSHHQLVFFAPSRWSNSLRPLTPLLSAARYGEVPSAIPDDHYLASSVPVKMHPYRFCGVVVHTDFKMAEHCNLLPLVLECPLTPHSPACHQGFGFLCGVVVCQGRSKFGPLRRSKSRPVGEGVAVFVGRLERSLRSPFRAAQA